MGSDCHGDSSSTEWSNYNSSRSRESSPSPRHWHSRSSDRSRTRSRRTSEHKHISSPTSNYSKRSSRHRHGRSRQHHSGHSRHHRSASRGHYSHRSHGASHRSSDMPRAQAGLMQPATSALSALCSGPRAAAQPLGVGHMTGELCLCKFCCAAHHPPWRHLCMAVAHVTTVQLSGEYDIMCRSHVQTQM
jgi:hypothetical protein